MVEDSDVLIGAATSSRRHIKKRSLRNKSLAVSFSDKDLKDYITGFHKRKKKRRKEAHKNLQEKERLKRIEGRKKRKLEKGIGLNGSFLPEGSECTNSTQDNLDIDLADDSEQNVGDSGLKVYDIGEVTITVTNNAIYPRENSDEFHQSDKCLGVPSLTEYKNTLPLEKQPDLKVQRKKFKSKSKKCISQK